MFPIANSFEYEYRGCDLLYGRGYVDRLGTYLEEQDLERATIVCGSNVGANDELVEPIERALGDRLAGFFDETTPEKRIETAFEAIDVIAETGTDVVVGVGGGSSLDIARQASVFATDDRSVVDLRAEAREGTVDPPPSTADRLPLIVVPTTFAGADVSSGGSLEVLSAAESPTGQPVTVGGSVMPIANVADPALFETTPTGALAGSAMNGFNKGIETLYARDASPVSDATAIHGLRLLSDALPRTAGSEPSDSTDMDRAVVGSLLVQLNRKISIIHAFGHGFARRYDVQQGAVHAVVTPHVLRYLFETVDASRTLLATGLGIDPDEHAPAALAEEIVDAVIELRDALDVPTRIRELPGTEEADLPAIAEFIVDDPAMERTPAGVEPSPDEIETVLRTAW